MARTVAETIAHYTKEHLLNNNGLLLGQCLTAVGWVGGTVPPLKEEDGIIELPTCDVAGGGVACGVALAGRRPIFIVRYQGFMWYDAASLVNYAAKSKEVWNQPCPVFIRSIGMEHNGIGMVASSCHHGLFMRMPGMPICAPMTPNEWKECWKWYLAHDDPVMASEHRRSFTIDYEMNDIVYNDAVVTIVAISAGRLNAIDACKILEDKYGIRCNLIHLMWLKPLKMSDDLVSSVKKSLFSVVVDSDFEICGPSRSIAYDIMHITNKSSVYALGLEDRTCGVSRATENCTPSTDKIVQFVLGKMESNHVEATK